MYYVHLNEYSSCNVVIELYHSHNDMNNHMSQCITKNISHICDDYDYTSMIKLY
jgi:hypothetical protein